MADGSRGEVRLHSAISGQSGCGGLRVAFHLEQVLTVIYFILDAAYPGSDGPIQLVMVALLLVVAVRGQEEQSTRLVYFVEHEDEQAEDLIEMEL